MQNNCLKALFFVPLRPIWQSNALDFTISMQRIQSIDILKLFAMFLVIWGHCVQFMLTSDYLDEPAFVYIYSFHLPLFFMISGLFVHGQEFTPSSCGQQLLVKARQLLLPCLSWGLLMSAGNLAQSLLSGTPSANSLIDTLVNNFWFLKSLFVCFLLWYVSITILRRRWLALIVSLLISQCITEWSVQWSYPTFAIGIFIAPYLSQIHQHRRSIALIALICGGMLLVFWNRSHLTIPSVYTWTDLAPTAVLANIGMRLYKIAVNTALSLGLIALFLGLEPRLQAASQPAVLVRLASWGRLTLGIYIIHTLIIIVRERLCPALLCCDSLNPWFFNTVIAPLTAAMLLLVSVCLTQGIMRLPRLSFFLLGTPWRERQSV